MSIIYDALKKVERAVETPAATAPLHPADFAKRVVAAAGQPQKKRRGPFMAVIMAFIALTLLSAFAILIVRRAAVASSASKTHVSPKTAAPQDFDLSGVFNSGPDAYAILNNKIVKTGDTINGAVVRAIRNDEIELESGGSIRTYSTRLK